MLKTNENIHKRSDATIRWVILPLVVMSGWAFDQVELPIIIYVLYGYLSAVIYLYFAATGKFKGRFGWLLWIPTAYFFVTVVWSLAIGSYKFDILTTLLMCEFLLLDRDTKAWIFEKYRKVLVWMCGAGIICFISFVFRLGLPYQTVDFYSQNSLCLYANYHVSYILFGDTGFFFRLCGLFNEPGFLGTVAALVLIVEDLNFNRFGNIIIGIAGVFSFSMAFWVLVFIYFLFKNSSYIKQLIISVLLAGIVIGGVVYAMYDNPMVQMLVSRFEIKDGKISGSNRTDEKFDYMYEKFLASDKIIFGEGIDAMEKYQIDNTSSLEVYIFKFGIVGFTILFGTLFVCALRYSPRRNYHELLLILCFFISAYQRPQIFTLVYLCILFGGIDIIRKRNSAGFLHVRRNKNTQEAMLIKTTC